MFGNHRIADIRRTDFSFRRRCHLGVTWCDILVRTRNDFEMTMLKQRNTAIVHDSINVVQQETPSQYKIMGTLMKNGKNLFGSSKERLKRENEGTIRKFI